MVKYKVRRNTVQEDIEKIIGDRKVTQAERYSWTLYISRDVFNWLNRALSRQGQRSVRATGAMYFDGIRTEISSRLKGFEIGLERS